MGFIELFLLSPRLTDSTSEEPVNRGSMEKDACEHDQETSQDESVSVSESSSTCTHPLPVTRALEVPSGGSLSDPSTRAAILLRMQTLEPVLFLTKIKVTKEVCPWAPR